MPSLLGLSKISRIHFAHFIILVIRMQFRKYPKLYLRPVLTLSSNVYEGIQMSDQMPLIYSSKNGSVGLKVCQTTRMIHPVMERIMHQIATKYISTTTSPTTHHSTYLPNHSIIILRSISFHSRSPLLLLLLHLIALHCTTRLSRCYLGEFAQSPNHNQIHTFNREILDEKETFLNVTCIQPTQCRSCSILVFCLRSRLVQPELVLMVFERMLVMSTPRW